jgi:hypothetical protein
MAEHGAKEVGIGAVAVVDALGFRAARTKHAVGDLVGSIRRVRDRMQSGAQLDSMFGIAETTVAAFSDAIIVAACPPEYEGRRPPGGSDLPMLVGHLAGSVSTLVTEAASASVPLAYRGCVAAGSLTVVDDIFIGNAIDEAAEFAEQALAAVVWLAPSAVFARRGRPQSMVLLEWDVPLRDRGPLRTLVVNPFFSVPLDDDDSIFIKKMEAVECALLKPFDASQSVDVALKRQYTEAFLREARRFSVEMMPDARRSRDALLASLQDDDDLERP